MASDETADPDVKLGDAETAAAEPPSKSGTKPDADRSPSQQRLAQATRAVLFSDEGDPLARGSVFAGRYRIDRRLGEGGMGEVFRAHDEVLGEDVALKLLPPSLAARPGYHERFVQEVRLARQVSHPSICRVHDIGEASGRPFLSMEYVDGEDLASLLRRIGRFGPEKALELSHQLCSGLAALHERGIIHRDLKPANIMVDGDGHIRIADFGLASIAEELGAHEIRDGTPAYQAPEQREGRAATPASDVFALGLVLHEMFFGQRPTRSDSRTATASATGVDAAVQSVIEQCLAEDPVDRFADALAVLGALPGGDPLAAALAAGRLPSPDAVANTRAVGGLAPWAVRSLLGLFAVCLFALAGLNAARSALALDDGLLSPAVLEDRVAQLSESLRITEPAIDVVSYNYRRGWLNRFNAEDDPAGALRASDESVFAFTVRGFAGMEAFGTTRARDIPPSDDGDVELTVDGHARLLAVHWERHTDARAAFGETVAEEDTPAPFDGPDWTAPDVWDALFAAAQIDRADLEPTEGDSLPPVFADAFAVWHGPVRGVEADIYAAASKSRPVWFQIATPGLSDKIHVNLTGWPVLGALFLLIAIASVMVVCIRVAISTIRGREGDFKGARQVGITVVLLELSAWALRADGIEWASISDAVLKSLGFGVASWLCYLMLEPYARAQWPKALVSWNRLLRGRWRDPMIGRDLLVGTVAGCASALLYHANPSVLFAETDLELLLGPLAVLGWLPNEASGSLLGAFGVYIALLGIQRIVRLRLLAVLALVMLVPAVMAVSGDPMEMAVGLTLHVTVSALILVRFGLLALVFQLFAVEVARGFPITLELGAWYGKTGVFGALLLCAMAILGARLCSTARAG